MVMPLAGVAARMAAKKLAEKAAKKAKDKEFLKEFALPTSILAGTGITAAAIGESGRQERKEERDRQDRKEESDRQDRKKEREAKDEVKRETRGMDVPLKKGGMVKSSASKRADGIAVKGKTKGRIV